MVNKNLIIWFFTIFMLSCTYSIAEGAVLVEVLTKDKKQIEGAFVFVNIDNQEEVVHVKTDSKGLAQANAPVEAKSFSLTIFKLGYYPETMEVTDEQSIEVELKKVTRKITARIITLEGVPVPNAIVKVGEETFQANEQGVVDLTVDSLNNHISVSIDSGCTGNPVQTEAISFTEGEMSKELDFTIEALGVFRIQVLGSNGRALKDVKVIYGEKEIGLTGKDGTVNISFCRGKDIRLEKSCYKKVTPSFEELSNTIKMKPVKISFRGRVSWDNGNPVCSRTFFINDELLVRTDNNGFYEGRINCEELPLESLCIRPAVDKGFAAPRRATAKVYQQDSSLNIDEVTFTRQ